MAKKVLTVAETLRSFTPRKWEAARDYIADMDEIRGVLEEAKDKIEEANSAVETLQELAEFIPALAEKGVGTDEQAQNVADTITELAVVMSYVPSDDIEAFVENYEAARDALDEYADLKEQDSYAGKREELEDSWANVEAALEALSDNADILELTI